MRLLPIAAALFSLAGGAAAAEPVAFADLQGLTLEANWIEDMTIRTESDPKPRESRSPRQVTLAFGPGDAIAHKLTRVAGKNVRTENRQMQIGKTQPTSIGFVRWTLEGGKLVYVETLFSGARRLVVSIERKGGRLTCSIAAGVAREGNKPVLTTSLANNEKVELIEVKTSGGGCTIGKS